MMKGILCLSLFLIFIPYSIADPFPSSRCYVYNCFSSPWDISWITESNQQACFKISRKPGICFDNSQYSCCNALNNNLHKIVLSTRASCKSALKNVMINNTIKSGGVFFDVGYDNISAELTLTTLRLTSNIADNTIICLNLQEPCSTIYDFCVESKTTMCRFSIYDSSMKCCPTCFMLNNVE